MKGKLRKIDIEQLSEIVDIQGVKDFYLSPDDKSQKLRSVGDSVIFNGFMLVLCTSGMQDIYINGRRHQLTAGSILLLLPNQLTELKHCSEDFIRRSIVVSLDYILEFPSPIDVNIMNVARKRPVIQVSDKEMNHLLSYYDFIETQYSRTKNSYQTEISKTLLYALMLEICDIYKSASLLQTDRPKIKQEKLSDDFFILLTHHYKQERSVTFYANKMHLTPKYLSGAIKRITGRSILEWINEVVVVEIKILLKTTDLSVLQISEELNFSTPSVFVQFFKLHTGTTPLKYRKNTD